MDNFVLISILTVALLFLMFVSNKYSSINKTLKMFHKPLGFIRSKDYENDVSVVVENHGTGPMIIKNITITNNETLESNTNFLLDMIPTDVRSEILWSNYTSGYSNRILRPGENLELIKVGPRYESEDHKHLLAEHRSMLREALSKLTITLEFTDIFESPSSTISTNLNPTYGSDRD